MLWKGKVEPSITCNHFTKQLFVPQTTASALVRSTNTSKRMCLYSVYIPGITTTSYPSTKQFHLLPIKRQLQLSVRVQARNFHRNPVMYTSALYITFPWRDFVFANQPTASAIGEGVYIRGIVVVTETTKAVDN